MAANGYYLNIGLVQGLVQKFEIELENDIRYKKKLHTVK